MTQLEQTEALVHWRHLAGQEEHFPLLRYNPLAQEVHSVMLEGLQVEHDAEHPRQAPETATIPFLQVVQVAPVQTRQFLGQLVQALLLRVRPGGQLRHVVAEVEQVTQGGVQGWHVLSVSRKAPLTHEVQLRKLGLLHAMQLGPHLLQALAEESNDHPLPQPVQRPVEQSEHPGGQSLIAPVEVTTPVTPVAAAPGVLAALLPLAALRRAC